MKTVVALSALGLALSAATVVVAQEDLIKARQELMKSNGKAMGIIGPMAKGEMEFDAAAAKEALKQIRQNAHDFDVETLFPEGSHEGETRADPKIWEEFDEFKEYAERWKTVSAEVAEADIASVEDLQPVTGSLGKTCGTCHEEFRQPEDK